MPVIFPLSRYKLLVVYFDEKHFIFEETVKATKAAAQDLSPVIMAATVTLKLAVNTYDRTEDAPRCCGIGISDL